MISIYRQSRRCFISRQSPMIYFFFGSLSFFQPPAFELFQKKKSCLHSSSF